ncbi:MAG: hypothetical protein SOX92_07005 [Candidatus Onthovivens sp.]|nr:hypothetical protein [Candidatus Onthovivens sp.]
MKKIFSAILCVIMILGCTSVAFATGWGKLEDNDTSCETYNINLYKLERVVGVMGEAFKVVPDATAKIGDIVYFTGYAMGENAINAMIYAFTAEDYVLTDLANIKADGAVTTDDLGGTMLPVFSARVTGNNPTVSVTIKSGNDVMQCYYNGKNVVTSPEATEVTLGDYTFVRDELNVVTKVSYKGIEIVPTMPKEEWDKATAGLAALDITMEAIANRQIYMSNEHLVRNFNNYKTITKIITWNGTVIPAPVPTPGLPQTGDMSVLSIALVAIFAAIMIVGVRKINVH